MFQTVGYTFGRSVTEVWAGFISIVPQIIVAILVFAIGWAFGAILCQAVIRIFRTLKIDEALKSAGLDSVMQRSGYNLNTGKFIGELVRWFVVVVFLIVSLNVVGLNDVNLFLKDVVLTYLPQVIIAVLMLVVAVVVAGAAEKFVIAGSKATNLAHPKVLGSVTKWAILVIGILAVLSQLQIAAAIIQPLVTGIIFALALATGLSFGLGGRDAAKDIIDSVKRDLTPRQ